MKKQFPSHINEFFQSAVEKAEETLLKDGYHTPMCFVFANGKIIPYLCNYRTPDEKTKWFDGFREVLGEVAAQGTIFISEGWARDLSLGEHQTKREILVISLASRYGNKMAMVEFERDTDNKIILGKREIKTEYCDSLIAPYFEQLVTVH